LISEFYADGVKAREVRLERASSKRRVAKHAARGRR
jgi:hypothetical protein